MAEDKELEETQRDIDAEIKQEEEMNYQIDKEFQQEVVDYFKGKNIKNADKLLMETARNNYKAGKQSERERILKIIKEVIHITIDSGNKEFAEGYHIGWSECLEELKTKVQNG
jgi:hypothetical protein